MINSSIGPWSDQLDVTQLDVIRILLSFSAGVISLLTLTCNALLIGVIVKSRALQTPTNVFMASLAVGEMSIGVFAIPFAAASAMVSRWPFSELTCQMTASMRTIGRSSSAYSLMAVCLDRCLAVSRPLRYSHILTVKSACALLALIWLGSLIMGLLPLWSWGNYSYDDAYYSCTLQGSGAQEQPLVKELACSFLPAAVILLSILQIIRELKTHHRIFSVVPLPVTTSTLASGEIMPGVMPGVVSGVMSGARGFNRKTSRAMRSLFVVTCGYACLCLPLSVINITHKHNDWPGPNILTFLVWLSFLCCVINPIIIIFFNRTFRSQLKSVLSCRRCEISKQEVFTISSGLHTTLDATLVLNVIKHEHASTTTSIRRLILGVPVHL